MFRTLFIFAFFTGFLFPKRKEIEIPCTAELDAIGAATHAEEGKDDVRSYLECVRDEGAADPNLPAMVQAELDANPYPAVWREGDIGAWFFDLATVKKAPESSAQLETAIARLDDQALARAAMGDIDVARAATARADKLRTLRKVIEAIE